MWHTTHNSTKFTTYGVGDTAPTIHADGMEAKRNGWMTGFFVSIFPIPPKNSIKRIYVAACMLYVHAIRHHTPILSYILADKSENFAQAIHIAFRRPLYLICVTKHAVQRACSDLFDLSARAVDGREEWGLVKWEATEDRGKEGRIANTISAPREKSQSTRKKQ